MMRKFRKSPRAFTLVELSVIIIIIGIFIAGIITADALIKKFRLQSAQALTKSSPITGITGNAIWLESSLDTSFLDSESNNSNAISTWNDQSVNVNKFSISQVGSGPVYSNTINYVHAVKFSGSTSNYLKIADASFLNNTDYTIVVLEKRQAASAGYFLSTTDVSDAADNKLALGYASDGVISHSHNSTNYAITPKVSAYADSTDKPRLFTFVQDSSAGKKTYINGTLSASDAANTSQLSGISTLAIGKGYTGEIGEIAIFTKVLTRQDREAVEDYLGKKWTRKINRASSASCINGIVTDSGCSNVCSTSVVVGVATPTQVSDGDSGTLSCNAAGYSGAASVSYNCSNGNLNPVGTCAAISCTASGTGYSKTGLAYATSGSGSFACDTGYSGTINYTCTSTGAASITGGSCTATTCTASGTGYSKTGLAYATGGSGSFACDAGYSGTINYTCTATGAATDIAGTCTPVTCTAAAGSGYAAQSGLAYATSGSGSFSCTTGYTGTKNYTCTSAGAATITGGTCTAITCTAPAGTGYAAQSNLPYAASGSGSFSCTTGTGTINYTCTSTGVATITGGACSAAVCTGGTVDTSISGTTIHMFTSNGTLNCTGAGARSNVQVLVVAGGGGGTTYGGGGGGGGVVYKTNHSLSASSYSVTVGGGGAGNIDVNGGSGGNSVFDTMTAYGGGGGTGSGSPVSGGSGGGSGRDSGNSVGGAVIAGIAAGGTSYGNVGGGSQSAGWDGGGGGGGAGAVGGLGRGNGSTAGEVGGNGGNGIAISITSGSTASYPGTYGGGGGGSVSGNTSTSSGGTGGGGSGGRAGTNGTANTGGGGGGGMKIGQNGGTSIVGSGGSGVVIIRYVN